MSIVKNQHYVPKRYLKAFANKFLKENSCIYRCNVFDKLKKEERKNQNIENIASERYFYDVDFSQLVDEMTAEGHSIDPEIKLAISEIDKQTIEKIFATKHETDLFDPISQIITAYTLTQKSAYSFCPVIPSDRRAMISYYLSLQFIRTKEFRETFVQLHENGTEQIMKKLLRGKVPNDILSGIQVKLKENRVELLHAQFLMNIGIVEQFAASFLEHIWVFAVSAPGTEFWTSDSPIVRNGHLGDNGFRSAGIEIVYPITPNVALVMLERRYFDEALPFDNRFIEVDEHYVDNCNLLQLSQSYRNIFAKDADLSLVVPLLENNPSLSNPKRARFIVH